MLFVPELGLRKGGLVGSLFSHRIWRGVTNECTNGGGESNATGFTAFGGSTTAPTRITTDSKYGIACVQGQAAAAANSGVSVPISGAGTFAKDDVVTCSCWFKGDVGETYGFYVDERNAAGTYLATNATSKTYIATGNWQRAILTVTLGNASTSRISSRLGNTPSTAVALNYKVDGGQYEKAAEASPPLNTDGAAASRGARRLSLAA